MILNKLLHTSYILVFDIQDKGASYIWWLMFYGRLSYLLCLYVCARARVWVWVWVCVLGRCVSSPLFFLHALWAWSRDPSRSRVKFKKVKCSFYSPKVFELVLVWGILQFVCVRGVSLCLRTLVCVCVFEHVYTYVCISLCAFGCEL